jgi:DtxR family Mn-dependent transcriptional regulator
MPKQVKNTVADDYLTSIYRMAHDENITVIAARLAERLNVTPPTVAGMLKRLERDNLVRVNKRKEITLTDEGLQRAEQMVRRHRLAELLLTEVLGLEWWRAYEEAHLMEHGISEIVEPHLFRVLGEPETSPFGYPIPDPATGAAPDVEPPVPLASCAEGDEVTIDRVFEEDERLLKYFDDEGIRPGVRARLHEIAPYRGTVTIVAGGRELTLGLEVAHRLWVRPVEEMVAAG